VPSAIGIGSLSDGKCDQLVVDSEPILGERKIGKVHFHFIQIAKAEELPRVFVVGLKHRRFL
jgi:hypothetical protein